MISYAGGMRGGLERWKRGVNSQGVRQAIAYAMEGTCDAHIHAPSGVDALGHYSDVDAGTVTRFVVEAGQDQALQRLHVEGQTEARGFSRGLGAGRAFVRTLRGVATQRIAPYGVAVDSPHSTELDET